ncbi:MAG: YsnF/AvaK domain-containing protein [Ktedonobacteraceae bacterium]
MALTGRTVIGVFDEAANADRAIDALQTAGFNTNDIHHSGRVTDTTSSGGGFLTSIKNFFTGNDTTATTGGHVANDLTGMGVSNEEAQYYDNEYKNGRTVVSVNAGDRAAEAKTILDTNGAYNYSRQRGTAGPTSTAATTGTTYTNDSTRTGNTAYTDTATTGTTTDYDRTRDAGYANENDAERSLRLREEQLNVNKERVQSGEVSVGKNVIEEQKTINVPVTHEEVYVERRDVTGNVTEDATPIGEGESIRVPVSEERVNVSKDTVVTGEVSVGKRAVQENQQVTDTVRREEARLDQTGNPRVSGNDVNNYDTTRTDRADTNYDNTRTDNTDTRNSF